MGKKRIGLIYKNRKIFIEVRCNFYNFLFGLMFRRRESARPIFFTKKIIGNMGIHSFFVSFPFLAIYADEKNNVLDIKKVSPSTAYFDSKSNYSYLVEIPFNKTYRNICNFFEGRKI